MLEMPLEPSKQPCFLSLHESPLGLTKTRVPQTCARALTKPQFWEKSPGTASSTFHFFWSAKEVAADPLGLLQLREVTGEQKGKTSGCRWCSPLRHQGCQCQDSCQPPASSLQPAGGPQATFCRGLADLPLSVLLSVLFLFVNLFPALFPP